MGSDDDKWNEMALKLTKAATDRDQGDLEGKNRSNSTTQLTDNPTDNPVEIVEIVEHTDGEVAFTPKIIVWKFHLFVANKLGTRTNLSIMTTQQSQYYFYGMPA